MPSLRAGQCRWQAGRTKETTLANDAFWHVFPAHPDNPEPPQFVRLNVAGVWFSVDDMPDWDWGGRLDPWDGYAELVVVDWHAGLRYHFIAADTAHRDEETGNIVESPDGWLTREDYCNKPAKLWLVYDLAFDGLHDRRIDYPPEFWSAYGLFPANAADLQIPPLEQWDTNGGSIEYDITPQAPGSPEVLTVTARNWADPGEGTRSATCTFDPPSVAGADGTRPLTSATFAGNGSSRTYEWFPVSDPPTARDRKLRRVGG